MSDEKNTPIWKKEISFRRKPDEAAPESDAGSASIWKKEISLGKKGKRPTPTVCPRPTPTSWSSRKRPLEAAPAVDLDLIARYAPLPEPDRASRRSAAGTGRAGPDRAGSRSSRPRSSTTG